MEVPHGAQAVHRSSKHTNANGSGKRRRRNSFLATVTAWETVGLFISKAATYRMFGLAVGASVFPRASACSYRRFYFTWPSSRRSLCCLVPSWPFVAAAATCPAPLATSRPVSTSSTSGPTTPALSPSRIRAMVSCCCLGMGPSMILGLDPSCPGVTSPRARRRTSRAGTSTTNALPRPYTDHQYGGDPPPKELQSSSRDGCIIEVSAG